MLTYLFKTSVFFFIVANDLFDINVVKPIAVFTCECFAKNKILNQKKSNSNSINDWGWLVGLTNKSTATYLEK